MNLSLHGSGSLHSRHCATAGFKEEVALVHGLTISPLEIRRGAPLAINSSASLLPDALFGWSAEVGYLVGEMGTDAHAIAISVELIRRLASAGDPPSNPLLLRTAAEADASQQAPAASSASQPPILESSIPNDPNDPNDPSGHLDVPLGARLA